VTDEYAIIRYNNGEDIWNAFQMIREFTPRLKHFTVSDSKKHIVIRFSSFDEKQKFLDTVKKYDDRISSLYVDGRRIKLIKDGRLIISENTRRNA